MKERRYVSLKGGAGIKDEKVDGISQTKRNDNACITSSAGC